MHVRLSSAEIVADRREAAVARLAGASGDASLCQLSRAGTPRPAVKYHEGAVAALTDVRRRLPDRADQRDVARLVADVRDRWVAGRVASRPADWQAYDDGAVDALESLTEALGRAAEPAGGTAVAGALESGTPPTVGATVAAAAPPEVDAAGQDLAEPAPSCTAVWTTWSATRPAWSRRRTVAALLATPPLLALFAAEGGGWAPDAAPLWTVLVTLVSVTAATLLATYLPAPGSWRRPGPPTPCGVVPVLTVLAAGWLLGAESHAPAAAVGALAVVSFGLARRLAGACCSP